MTVYQMIRCLSRFHPDATVFLDATVLDEVAAIPPGEFRRDMLELGVRYMSEEPVTQVKLSTNLQHWMVY